MDRRRLEVKLADVAKSDVKINKSAGVATVSVKCDEILDPVADNLPEGVGEIKSVKIVVDGDEFRGQVNSNRGEI